MRLRSTTMSIWSGSRRPSATFFPTVVNGNFVINDLSDLSNVEILIAITESQYLGGFTLWLDVVNPITSTPNDYTPIFAGGSPLMLTFAAGYDNNGNANDLASDGIFGSPNPAADTDLGGYPNISKQSQPAPPAVHPAKLAADVHARPSDPNLGGVWSGPTTIAVLTSLTREWSSGFFDQRDLHRKLSLACRSRLSGRIRSISAVPTVFIGWRFSLDHSQRRRPVPARNGRARASVSLARAARHRGRGFQTPAPLIEGLPPVPGLDEAGPVIRVAPLGATLQETPLHVSERFCPSLSRAQPPVVINHQIRRCRVRHLPQAHDLTL